MRTLVAALLLLLPLAGPLAAQPLEPPPEAPEGEDYTAEPIDSLAAGEVEMGLSAAGRAGSAPSRRRRLRFSGDDLSGAVREGSDDPLAGGSLDGRARLGTFTVGRLAPRWGRGLLLGAAGDPWQREALDRGSRARFRGRAGDGLMLRRGERDALEALVGRFGRRRLAGLRARHAGVAAGTLSDGRGAHQASLALARGSGDVELVMDRAGRWRAEALLERALERPPEPGGAPRRVDRASTAWRASLRARAGGAGFASLAEGGRPGPAQALALGFEGPTHDATLAVVGALWRFRPGVAGARAGLAVERALAHHGALAFGFEEQRGARRDRGETATLASLASRAAGMRQGWWGEWWSGPGPLALGLRHESWGERPWARSVVRSVTTARVEARGPAAIALGVTHSVYRVRRGESLYLPEAESDRLVLRAVSGEGERTRIEGRAPFAGGRLRATLGLAVAGERRARPQWTLDWTRRARLRRPAGAT